MEKELGKVTIAPQVLVTIARLTTLGTLGVACMSPTLVESVSRMLRRERLNEGIKIVVEDDIVYIDLYIIVEPNVNLLRLGRQIQHDVTRAINDMLGMHVGEVNIHIQDVVVPALQKPPSEEVE